MEPSGAARVMSPKTLTALSAASRLKTSSSRPENQGLSQRTLTTDICRKRGCPGILLALARIDPSGQPGTLVGNPRTSAYRRVPATGCCRDERGGLPENPTLIATMQVRRKLQRRPNAPDRAGAESARSLTRTWGLRVWRCCPVKRWPLLRQRRQRQFLAGDTLDRHFVNGHLVESDASSCCTEESAARRS